MFADNLKSIITMAAPVSTGASFVVAIITCVAVIVLSVLVMMPLAGGVK